MTDQTILHIIIFSFVKTPFPVLFVQVQKQSGIIHSLQIYHPPKKARTTIMMANMEHFPAEPLPIPDTVVTHKWQEVYKEH